MRSILSASIAFLGLAACQTGLTEPECAAGAWQTYGFQDGVDGRPQDYVTRRVDQCARFEIGLDPALYETGRQEGLAIFCTPEGARQAALRRVGDIDLCVGAPALTFDAYAITRNYVRAESAFTQAENDFARSVRRLDELERDRYKLARRLRKEKDEEAREKLEKELARTWSRIRETRIDLDREAQEERRARRRLREASYNYERVLDDILAYERDAVETGYRQPPPPAPVGPDPVPPSAPAAPAAGPVTGTPAPDMGFPDLIDSETPAP